MADPKSKIFDKALAFHNAGNAEKAEPLYREVLTKFRNHTGACNNLAVLLKCSGRLDEAETFYKRLLTIAPNDPGARYNYALLQEKRGDLDGAGKSYLKVLTQNKNHSGALNNLGALCVRIGKSAEAIPYLERAVATNPNEGNARLNFGIALRAQRRLAESLEQFRACVQIDPNGPLGWVEMATSASEACDFDVVEESRAHVERVASISGGLSGNFDLAGLCNIHYLSVLEGTTAVAARAAAAEIVRRLGMATPSYRPLPASGPLRIGYMSKNLGNHAIGHVSHGVYGNHDRSRFQIFGYGMEDRSFEDALFHRTIRSGCDQFRDVQSLEPPDIAAMIAADGIDILVHLDGQMSAKGIEVMSRRPAPIQVSWLGVAGSPGLPYYDYVIADRVVVRDGEQSQYPEKVVRLPECYHSATPHEVATEAPSRAAEGLPEDALVLCVFNNTQKIERRIFKCWMDIMTEIPNSVLWLSHTRSSATVISNLQRDAEAAGIAGNRLIFSKMEDAKTRHLRRHDLADLFLDTLSLTASTTALDVLWMGLPMVACPGETWPSRISASFLTCLGLSEFITPNLDAYRSLALTLCRDPVAREAARQKFLDARQGGALFDVGRFTRHLEGAYQGMAERYRAGLAPDGFDVVEP